MTKPRQVYLLDPQNLSPETIAVTFAKTSRSPESFKTIAEELTDEKSAKFHEKWVVGYGHSSVAEHATLHIAVENVSRLAVEVLEGNRLASYTEKSTRYQQWDADSFAIPPELEGHPLRDAYVDTCRMLFAAYQRSLEALHPHAKSVFPRMEGESDSAYERRLRTEYIDVARFLLPAASLTNVGMTINARALEHALCKMLSHPLAEVRQMGEDIKLIAQKNVPTLVKYAHALPYLQTIEQRFEETASHLSAIELDGRDWCRLVDYDRNAEDKVLAAVLYRYSQLSYEQCQTYVTGRTIREKIELAQALLGDCNEHTTPLRELEHAFFTFDLTLDQGAYYELKRHRMMTQTTQILSTTLGYATPRWMTESGFGAEYHAAMRQADEVCRMLAEWNPQAAAYVVPNGFNRRVLLTLNLRSADHLFELRSAPNAHFSIRRAAQRMCDEIMRVYPLLGPMLRHTGGETWQEIEEKYFTSLH